MKAVQSVRNTVCPIRTAAGGETAGRNINSDTEGTNCEEKPAKFR